MNNHIRQWLEGPGIGQSAEAFWGNGVRFRALVCMISRVGLKHELSLLHERGEPAKGGDNQIAQNHLIK